MDSASSVLPEPVSPMIASRSPAQSENETSYPGGGRNAENFDWKKVSFETPIPEDVTDAKLNLGLQNISGTVYFRNVRLEIIDDSDEE